MYYYDTPEYLATATLSYEMIDFAPNGFYRTVRVLEDHGHSFSVEKRFFDHVHPRVSATVTALFMVYHQ
jgi:hypothetical protein